MRKEEEKEDENPKLHATLIDGIRWFGILIETDRIVEGKEEEDGCYDVPRKIDNSLTGHKNLVRR